MAKKQQEKQYIPSKEELESHLICTKEGIAYSISRAYPNEDARYYVERYEIKNYKKTQYITITFSLKCVFSKLLSVCAFLDNNAKVKMLHKIGMDSIVQCEFPFLVCHEYQAIL